LAELLGICWHDPLPFFATGGFRCDCGDTFSYADDAIRHQNKLNTDFISDPRLVLVEMAGKLKFFESVGIVKWVGEHIMTQRPVAYIRMDYILDTTGLLAKAAVEWLRKEKK
jgi:hypothetical protein